jgi:cytochrome c biogenesis protein CcmG/thiol:disulfide interchange protein DsbE
MTTHQSHSEAAVTAASRRADPGAAHVATSRRRMLALLPAAGLAGLAGLMAIGLTRDPSILPSALIGRKVPEFSLPPVRGRKLGLANADLLGAVSLVNFFASWCVACREEHAVLLDLGASGAVPLYGIDYKDEPADGEAWLNAFGDPYRRTGADLDGRVAIDWGLYGVPETYVVDAGGIIRHRHVGAVTKQDLQETILPLVATLRQTKSGTPS